jgi:hypothetical protein
MRDTGEARALQRAAMSTVGRLVQQSLVRLGGEGHLVPTAESA